MRTQPSMSGPPLSPHLQIYRWTLTMVLSILHRASGVVLSVGMLVLAGQLVLMAGAPGPAACVAALLKSPVGIPFLAGWLFALCFHACTGVRHLVMDAGFCLDPGRAALTGWLAVAGSVILTVLIALAILGGGS